MSDAFIEIVDGATRWRFEREFLESNWRCLFGDGCQGILPEPAAELNQGCCSLGAHLGDGPDGQQEAMNLAAYAAALAPEQWQFHHLAHTGTRDGVIGVFRDDDRDHTLVVDGACIFLNRPGFAGGSGCALHIAALAGGESPIEWKPSVCWQLPLRVDWRPDDRTGDDTESATVRRWTRADWGDHGTTMAWCCTERGGPAYSGDRRVVDSLAGELAALAGDEVYVELRRRLTEPSPTAGCAGDAAPG